MSRKRIREIHAKLFGIEINSRRENTEKLQFDLDNFGCSN